MELQFIYNTKNGWANSIIDLVQKNISPETYQCNLCKITHGTFTENKKFKEFKKKYNITLWHIGDYELKYNKELTYPLIIFRDVSGSELYRIESHTINEIKNVTELEKHIKIFKHKY